MKNKLKKFLLIFLCIPVICLVGCGKKEVAKIKALDYYFNNSVTTSFFNPDSTRNLSLADLTLKKPNKDLLDSYSEFVIKPHSEASRTYHLYIDYIIFYVYTNESSDKEFNLYLTIENVIDENKVGTEQTDKTFKDNRVTYAKKEGSAEFRFDINKVVATTTGATIKFDIFNTEIYNTPDDKKVTFKWLIYGLEIHAEPRAYN